MTNLVSKVNIPLILIAAGIVLTICHGVCVSNMAKDDRYANRGKTWENLNDLESENLYEITDANLVWMMRSKEYREASNDGKYNMRHAWATEYIDKKIGRLARITFSGCLIVIPIIVLMSRWKRCPYRK